MADKTFRSLPFAPRRGKGSAMHVRCHRWIAAALLLAGTAAEAEDGIQEKLVPSHRFEVILAPQDAQSTDARTADLYVTRFPGAGWNLAGSCAIFQTPDGPRFKRVISVADDGTYYFASAAGDAAGKTPPPVAGSQPQARVVVDTTRPSLNLDEPLGHETLQ